MNSKVIYNSINYSISIFFIITNLNLLSQNRITTRTSLLLEKIGLFDSENKGDKYGYAFNIGCDLNCSKKNKLELNQTIDYYYYTHEKHGASSVLATLLMFRLKLKKISLDTKIGPGYLLFHNYTSVYKRTNGSYVKSSNYQNKLAGILSLGLSYIVNRIKPYIAYNIFVETPLI